MRRPLLVPACAAVVLAGCGSAPGPVPSFDADAEGTRVWEAYDRTGTERVTALLDEDAKEPRVRLDCVGASGEILVDVGDGAAGVPCSEEAGTRDGYVGLSPEAPVPAGDLRVTVTAPEGARWSVALDARP